MGRRVLGVVALGLFTVCVLFAAEATAGSKTVFTGSAAVQALGTAELPFTVTASMRNPRVSGRLTASGGTGNDIEIAILTDADLVNWKNGHEAKAHYQSGRVTVAVVDATLSEPGSYFVVLSNKFSGVTPKTITGELTLAWDDPPPSPPVEQTSSDTKVGATGSFVASLGGAAALGAAIVLVIWFVSKRRRAE